MIELGKVAGAIIALATLTGLTWKVTRTMIRTMRKLGRLADEIMGDGDRRPGWGRRLTKIETDVADLLSAQRPLSATKKKVEE